MFFGMPTLSLKRVKIMGIIIGSWLGINMLIPIPDIPIFLIGLLVIHVTNMAHKRLEKGGKT